MHHVQTELLTYLGKHIPLGTFPIPSSSNCFHWYLLDPSHQHFSLVYYNSLLTGHPSSLLPRPTTVCSQSSQKSFNGFPTSFRVKVIYKSENFCYSKYVPLSSSTRDDWEFVREAESRALPRTKWIWLFIVTESQVAYTQLKVWQALIYQTPQALNCYDCLTSSTRTHPTSPSSVTLEESTLASQTFSNKVHALDLWLSHWMFLLPEMISSRHQYHQFLLTSFKSLLKHHLFKETYPDYSKIANCPSPEISNPPCLALFFPP